MKQSKKVRVADILISNMTSIAVCTDVNSLKSEVSKVIKDNYDLLSDKDAADNLLKIVSKTKNRTALFSTIATYLTNIKVATVD